MPDSIVDYCTLFFQAFPSVYNDLKVGLLLRAQNKLTMPYRIRRKIVDLSQLIKRSE
jgi:hypothetical protein